MEHPPLGERTCLYQTAQLDTVLNNMARQAAGVFTSRENVMMVGILRRGAPLAGMLHKKLISQFDLTNIIFDEFTNQALRR